MNPWSVQVVTAFGRGESLALALHDKGFDVSVYDLTEAFPFEYRRGTGPFPIAKQAYLGTHEGVFMDAEALPRGLTVWLKDGPVEFNGPMAPFYVEANEAFRLAVQNEPSPEFAADWLRRFIRHFVAPYHRDSWVNDPGPPFPVEKPPVLIPRVKEKSVTAFERVQNKNLYHVGAKINDIQIESGRITEMEIDTGRPVAVRAPQWVWCLSSQETEFLNPTVAEVLFSRDVRRAEWLWMSLEGRAERGPWSEGFPRYSVVIEDIHLPWTHANMFVLEWIAEDQFEVWLKVPAEAVRDASKRTAWAVEVERVLNRRLALAHFRVDPLAFAVCPHSLVFPEPMEEWKAPGWKNWDWIAPETLNRLDLGARFEREVASYQRLMDWRNDQIKKQGVRGDQAIHAP